MGKHLVWPAATLLSNSISSNKLINRFSMLSTMQFLFKMLLKMVMLSSKQLDANSSNINSSNSNFNNNKSIKCFCHRLCANLVRIITPPKTNTNSKYWFSRVYSHNNKIQQPNNSSISSKLSQLWRKTKLIYLSNYCYSRKFPPNHPNTLQAAPIIISHLWKWFNPKTSNKLSKRNKCSSPCNNPWRVNSISVK